MTSRDDELLVEQAVSAWRPRAADGTIRFHPAWSDLAPTERRRVFDAVLEARAIEAGLDPDGLSTTARAVLARITLHG